MCVCVCVCVLHFHPTPPPRVPFSLLLATVLLMDGWLRVLCRPFNFTYPLTARDVFTTSFLHYSLFSTALLDLENTRPVHFLMSSHLFFCLSCFLQPFTVPRKMALARSDERETCPYHFSLRLFTMVRKSSCDRFVVMSEESATKIS